MLLPLPTIKPVATAITTITTTTITGLPGKASSHSLNVPLPFFYSLFLEF
jgi:hypothetical protein